MTIKKNFWGTLNYWQFYLEDVGYFVGKRCDDFLDWFDQPCFDGEFNEEWDWLSLALSNPEHFTIVFGDKVLWMKKEFEKVDE